MAVYNPEPGTIRWRIHLRSAPEKVYDLIATDEGRSRFWAAKTEESASEIHWEFPGGLEGSMKVYEKQRPYRFVCEYISESTVTFEISSDGRSGTDLTVTNSNVPEREMTETIAGWGSVLMNLKAVADHSVDLRNHDTTRTWDQGFFEN